MFDLAPNGPSSDTAACGGVDPTDPAPSRAGCAASRAEQVPSERVRALRAAIAQDPEGFIERRLGRALALALSSIR